MRDSAASVDLPKGVVIGHAIAATVCLWIAVYLAQAISPGVSGVGAIAAAFAVMLCAKYAHDQGPARWRWLIRWTAIFAMVALSSFLESSMRGLVVAVLSLFAAFFAAWALGSEREPRLRNDAGDDAGGDDENYRHDGSA